MTTSRGLRRNRSHSQSADQNALPQMTTAEVNTYWPDQAQKLAQTLWQPLDAHLIDDGTLIICSAGDMHNLCLTPGQSQRAGLVTRLPGLAFFAMSRGLYGAQTAPTQTPQTRAQNVCVLADEAAKDIPFAHIEGHATASLWRAQSPSPKLDYPAQWPDQSEPLVDFLHITGHGDLQKGFAGSSQSVILQGANAIGEQAILSAAPPWKP